MTPFHDLSEFMALPRVLGLRLSADGERLVTVVRALSPDRRTYQTALWRVDPEGSRGSGGSRRLTRSAAGEGQPAFLPDGSLVFTSRRRDAATGRDIPGLWLLPAGGGEARKIMDRPGGIDEVAVARDSGTIVFAGPTLPGEATGDPDRRKRREAAGVTAILHESHPVRAWDRQLGPDERRLFALPCPGTGGGPGTPDIPRDLTPEPGQALLDQPFAVTPDGATIVTGWWVPGDRGERHCELVAIDTATGRRRRLAAAAGTDFHSPAVSPDGRSVVCRRERHSTYTEPADVTLWLVALDDRTGGAVPEGRDLTPGLDLWPGGAAWSPDSRTVYFVADERGRRPVLRVSAVPGSAAEGDGERAAAAARQVPAAVPITRLTCDDAAYADLCPAPDGRHLYALRSAVDAPPAVVRLDACEPPVRAAGTPAERGAPVPLTGTATPLPGRLTEITATVEGGARVRAWLVLPEQASESAPAPMVLWPHGGPNASWNDWSWRWNPWLMAARGYAVLLPDPALSTGYGQDFLRRAHGDWGPVPYAELMTITDAAVARADIDEDRTAVMGGSYGGYMTNWVVGRTDRFKAAVTHASAWPLDAMITSDEAHYFVREFGDRAERPERWIANDPARHAAKIRTPMLIIHGDLDYRVPIGHALCLWWDLAQFDVEAKFLYFPDENHWILTPGNATVWYETVFAFLDRHVRGQEWRRPGLL